MLRFSEVVAQSNAIVVENAKTGNPASQWDIDGAGDLSIQGFATDISYNKGQTAEFKIKTDAAGYRIDIYRLGYYQGNGARLITGFDVNTASSQPLCTVDQTTGLLDCGNWAKSAQWEIPADAVSGIYIAKLTRSNPDGASHIAFIVRDDASTSDLLFQTSDATWQAYNVYGDNNNGRSLYAGVGGKASKVSYNRPFLTRSGGGGGGPAEDWLFNSEYPMIRFLEKNGYDMTYTTNVDTERRGGLITRHKVFMSVGHDEYWSKGMRDNVTAARDEGKHLAFFSGNEVYWKTRWENSIAGAPTDYRTLVCYKEGKLGENQCNGKCDPNPIWTGLWRSGCELTGIDGCDPENKLTGQVSWDGTTGTIQVPADYKNLRFWRNTAVASLTSGTHTLTQNTLGYEWNPEQEDYRGSYPAGRILLSKTVQNGKTHHLTLYKHSSGALVFGAGTVQWAWGLDEKHDRSSNEPVNKAMQQATVNLFADMGVQPESRQQNLVAATASTDDTAPALTVTSPATGANVAAGTTVNISGTASDAGTVAGIEVSTDEGKTWRLATGTTDWNFSWIPLTQGNATIRSRAFDDSGNLSAVNTVNVTVTAPAAQPCPCMVFQPTDVPSNNLFDDQNRAIQLGMKFSSNADGTVTGVRFYKQAGNNGTHTGQLYSNAGVKLAEVVFENETASGWQQANFSAPVSVTANTTYVISYHSSNGYYSAVNPYFNNAKVNGPLRALADNEDGNNGLYKYAASPAFPTENYQSSNYFVDVVFDDDAEDVTPPSISSVTPAGNADAVSAQTNITVRFNEAIDPSTISVTTIRLLRAGTQITAAVSYDPATFTALLNPSTALIYSTDYTIEVKGGNAGTRVKDTAGNALAANFTSTFTTQGTPPPSPVDGPGGPILVISSTDNPFSQYAAEILRAEGLNEFAAKDISEIAATPTLINSYDVIILGEIELTASQVTLLTNWTNAGGTLIAFRPAAQLASLFGITAASGSLSNKYLKINASGPGSGIVNETIQFHGTADLYTLSGATSLANLFSDAATATSNPAITTRNVGTNGGKAVAFTYDLAKSVVYTRQGNPAWAGQKRDGQINPIRSDDQFFPDWVDFNKIEIPQADEQQRLLANIILLGNMHKKPLPRFWYLPRGLKAAVVMTGDDHANGGTVGRFDDYISKSFSNNQEAVDNWTAIRATSYIFPGTPITDAQAAAFQQQGFEISLHLNTDCADFTTASLRSNFSTQLPALKQQLPSLAPPTTNRNHCITWSDWSSNPLVELENGIRLDANYYYWPAEWVNNRPGMFTGSGIPMRFADLEGNLIDVFQAATQLTDESGMNYSTHINKLLDNATGGKGYYGVFTANMHTDVNGANSSNGSDIIIAAAQQRQVPVISAKQMLTWLDGRSNSSFGAMAWNNNQLNFKITAASGSNNLLAMLPVSADEGQLTEIAVNGSTVPFTTETIKGIAYAFFPAKSGSYMATYDVDETGPQISNITVTQPNAGAVTIKWTTNEASDSRVDYGTASGQLIQNSADADLVTNHTVTFSGLAAGTTYYYRVGSTDAAANSSVMPAASATALSFMTPAAACFEDLSIIDFTAGNAGTNTYVTNDGILLKPAIDEEFSSLPPTGVWQSYPWTGGTSTISNGQIVVNGARYNTEQTSATFSSGTSVEFVATFQEEAFQNIGFGAGDNNQMFNSVTTWAMFGTNNSNNGLLARVGLDQTTENITIPGNYFGSAHRYKVVWKTNGIDFYVDNDLVYSSSLILTAPMRFAASDYFSGSLPIHLDWVRISPYAETGSFTSRVYDGGAAKTWLVASWTATIPAGSAIKLFQRQGNSSDTEDNSWSSFTPIASNGSNVGGTSRYIQYRADLSTTNPALTPALKSVSISCSAPVCPTLVFTPAKGTELPEATAGAPYSQDISTNLSGYTFTSENLPAGLSIHPTSGLISGTPATAGNNISITINASNDNCSESANFTLTIKPANVAPVFTTINDKTAIVGQELSFTATANDPDAGQTKTYSLTDPANGATIDPESGVFSWTPAIAGTFDFTIKVADNGNPSKTDSETFSVTVSPANVAPVLTTINDKTAIVGKELSFEAIANDPDAGQTLTYSLTGATNGALIDPESGVFSWTPATAGTFDFTIKVADNGNPSKTDSETFSVTVSPANVAPVLADISNKTAIVGQELSFRATANDPDAGQTLTYSLSGATNGATIDPESGVFSWTPATAGTFDFTIKVADDGNPSKTDSEPFSVTVSPANVAPVLTTINDKTAIVGQELSFTATANDPDAGQTKTYSLTDPANGATIDPESGVFSWTPATAGTFDFTIKVADNGNPSKTDSETFSVTVSPANVAPVLTTINDKTAIVGQELSFEAIANDSDAGQTLTYSLTDPANGATIDPESGVFSWTPATAGTFNFTIKVADNGNPSKTDSEAFSVTVSPANVAPVLTTINDKTAIVGQELSFTATATDPDAGQTKTYSLTDPANGATIDPESGVFSWTPATAGTFDFTIKVADNGNPSKTDSKSFSVTVSPANVAPVLVAIANKTAIVGQELSITAIATDPDDEQTLTYSLTGATNGALIDPESGVFSWTPATAGTFNFTVKVADNGNPSKTDSEPFSVTVSPANVAPDLTTINDKTAIVGQELSITATATDPDAGQTLTYSLTGATNGALIDPESGVFNWTPTAAGTFDFTIKVADNGNPIKTDSEPFSVTVSPANVAPVLTTINDKTAIVGQELSFEAIANDPDAGQTLTYSFTGATNGALIDPESGVFSWTPTAAGTFDFTIKVADNGNPSKTDSKSFSVTVSPANVAPVLVAIANKTAIVGQELSFTATANDPDAGQTKTYSLTDPANGATINATTGVFSWTPSAAGTFNFTVNVADNGNPSKTDSEPFSVTVSPANVAPVLTTINDKTAIVGQELSFTATATDPDAGQTKTYSFTGATNGATINATTGVFSWTPTAAGTFDFTIKVADNGNPSKTDSEPFSVTVSPANVAPVLADISNKTAIVGQELSFTATATDPDAGQTKTYSFTGATNGAAINPTTGVFSWTPSAAGTFNFTVNVADNGNPSLSSSQAFSVVASNPPVSARINAGGSAYTASGSRTFSADAYFGGTSTASSLPSTVDILNTTDDVMYRSARSAPTFSYSIPVQNGAYNVILHFAELYFGAPGKVAGGTGKRRFNVSIEGVTKLTNYDIYAVTGGAVRAVQETFPVTITDGKVSINFTSGTANQPIISAIEIVPQAPNQSPVLAAIGNRKATVNQPFTFTATATDANSGQTKTFSLTGTTNGATIGATSGVFNWTPTATGTVNFTVKVTDNGSPVGSDSETFSVTVDPANVAPVLATISNKTATVGKALTFTATATDANSGQTKTFSLTGTTNGAAINATSGAFSWTPATAGTFNFTVKVADNGTPSLSNSKTFSVVVSNPPPVAVRINAGGSAYTASGSRSFIADAYFGGTSTASSLPSTVDILNTTDDVMYRSARSAPTFSYGIPVQNGAYNVILHFAELYFGAPGKVAGGTGKRRFNVSIEGVTKLTNYDIYAKTGGAVRAVQETFPVTVTDGQMSINFTSGTANQPIISAIEVVPQTAARMASEEISAVIKSDLKASEVYPNPVQKRFTLKLSERHSGKINLKLISNSGYVQEIGKPEQPQTGLTMDVDISSQSPVSGIYILEIQSDSAIETLRLLITD